MPRVQGHGGGDQYKHFVGPSTISPVHTGSVNPEQTGVDTVLFDPNDAAANITQNLPSAAQNVGRTVTYVNAATAGAFSVTVQAAGGNTLNDPAGAAAAMPNGASVTAQAINSTTWQVIASS